MLEVIPAVDIKNVKCVRLYQGKSGTEKVYSEDPVSTALLWQELGAKRLHVVDLDGAFDGVPVNLHVLEKIVTAVSVPVQFGGGVRKMETLSMLFDIGIDRVVVGTIAVENPRLFEEMVETFPNRIVLGVDVSNGFVVTRGGFHRTQLKPLEFAEINGSAQLWGYLYTDVSKDGTLSGVAVDTIKRFAELAGKPVVVAGGISGAGDIRRLAHLPGVHGVVVGKALYEGTVTLKELLEAAGGK